MDREEALSRLNELVGRDVHGLAKNYGVQVRSAGGGVNKGWAGQVFERHLGLNPNSNQAPDFGSWELKVVPLKRKSNGSLSFKETMAITMIDPDNVAATPFENSHLLSKLRRAVVVAREVGDNVDEPSIVHSVNPLDLKGRIYDTVKNDYEIVQRCLRERGFSALTGRMGTFVQPRTKGAGHGSVSRAFYARPIFLAQFIEL